MLSRSHPRRTLILVVLGLAGRAFQTRRRARIHAFYVGWFAKKAAHHQEAAQDAREYGGENMLQIAREFEAQANAEFTRSEYHRELSHASWYALHRPWIIVPADPPEPPVP